MIHGPDFTVEILQYAPTAAGPYPPPLDVTDRVEREGIGSVNRSVERDLFAFRTGDLTLTLDDSDGFFTDLFAFFGATERWQLRVTRDAETLFRGIIIGLDSIEFERREESVAITAYGLSKVLDEVEASGVVRDLISYSLSAGVNPGDTSITLTPSAGGLLTGDVIRLDDQANSEDVVVKRLTSPTVVRLAAGLVYSHVANLTDVTVPKPFHRYRGVQFLVEQLFAAAAVPLAEYKVDGSMLTRLVPVPVNLGRLDAHRSWAAPAEINGRAYLTIEANGTYYQANAEDDWMKEDSSLKPWVDWSRYYTESEAKPTTILRFYNDVPIVDALKLRPGLLGYDYKPSTKAAYRITITTPPDPRLSKSTTTDGVSWGAASTVAALPDMAGKEIATLAVRHVEFDPVRNGVHATWEATDGSLYSRFYDIGGAAWSDLRQADDVSSGHYYFAPVYCADLDMTFMLRGQFAVLDTDFEIAAFRGTQRLWVRPFPKFNVDVDTLTNDAYVYPTESLRYVQGEMLCIVRNAGKLRLVRSKDEFQTHEIGDIASPGDPLVFGARVNGAYYAVMPGETGATAARLVIRADRASKTILQEADFEDLSVGQALGELAVLLNAFPWIDDDLQGHFVARDLLPAGDVIDITDRVIESSEVVVWDQVKQYVEVSGGGGAPGVAGDKDFISEGLSVSSRFIPNQAFAQVIAAALHAFFSKPRRMREVTVMDVDGRIYRQMGRVILYGQRWYVPESDHEMADHEWGLAVLEDLEGAA